MLRNGRKSVTLKWNAWNSDSVYNVCVFIRFYKNYNFAISKILINNSFFILIKFKANFSHNLFKFSSAINFRLHFLWKWCSLLQKRSLIWATKPKRRDWWRKTDHIRQFLFEIHSRNGYPGETRYIYRIQKWDVQHLPSRQEL